MWAGVQGWKSMWGATEARDRRRSFQKRGGGGACMVARAFSLAVEALVVALAGEAVDCLKQVRDTRGVACQARHALVHHHEVPDAPGCVAHEPHCMEGGEGV